MAIEEAVQAALAAVSGISGCYQDVAAQGAPAPYIVWLEVVSPTNNSHDGASNIQNTRIQIDVYAADPASRRTLAGAVKAAMAGLSYTNIQISSQNQYEPDVKKFRAILDYSVWG